MDYTSQYKKNTFYLNGLSCANCAAKIEKEINHNFEAVNFSFATKKLQLKSDMEPVELQSTLQKIVDDIEAGVVVDTSKEGQKSVAFIKKYIQTIIGAILVFSLIIVKPDRAIGIPFYVISYILIGGEVVTRAIRNLLKGNLFDEYFLMTIATIGAFLLGEFTEAVMVMFFYKVGEGFQDYAVDQSRRNIQSLLNIKADFANLIVDSSSKKVEPESLVKGDLILIKAGEKVPVDGMVIEGYSTVDTSALTGESLPRSIQEGDDILSGAINKDHVLRVKVTKTYENSTVARILDMVENATSKKAKTEQFITKFAKVYTPIVVLSAALLAFLPPVLGFGEFREWISRALIFLVISCPCALVLSVPLGYFGGLGRASRQGILIKGGNYLEALNNIDTFIFDKTGTLTKGNFVVQNVLGDNTLELAAKLEQHSTHPIAKSIVEAYGKDIDLNEVTQIKEIAGEGLAGVLNNKVLLAGNERLMKQYDINIGKAEYIGTIVYVAYDGGYIGSIHIADEIKEDVYTLHKALKDKGVKDIIMLTGDRNEFASYVASELNFDNYYSELLPQDKLKHVETIIDNGSKLLFVGDGINDAPVLARADIGVAMGDLGSDAAIEAADIVLMTDEPSKLIEAIDIAKKTRAIVLQNIIFALGVKVFFLTLGAFGVATMYEAIFADVGVAIIAVVNSMRILRK